MQKKLEISFTSEVLYWRGPAPFYFLKVPGEEATSINDISKLVSYGWGVIPCDVLIGDVEFYTALFPKEGSYLVPLKKAVRDDIKVDEGDSVKATIRINLG